MAPIPTPPRFEELYSETFTFVVSHLRNFGVALDDLDDAVQDVYLVIHRRLGSFEGRSTLTTWIYGIARRVAAQHRRKLDRLPQLTEDFDDVIGVGDPHEDLATVEGMELLNDLLMRLASERRAVFIMAELKELSGPQIAEALELELETVYWRLRVARAEFDRLLQQHNAQERWRSERAKLGESPNDDERRRRCWGALVCVLPLESSLAEAAPNTSVAATGLGVRASTIGWPLVCGVAAVIALAAIFWNLLPSEGAAQALPQDRVHQQALQTVPLPSVAREADRESAEGFNHDAVGSASQPQQPGRKPVKKSPPARKHVAKDVPGTAFVAVTTNSKTRTASGEPRLDVAAEARLLQSAQAALRVGNLNEALKSVDQHSKQFPKGALRRERRAMEIALHCALGKTQTDDARREFLRQFGDRALDKALSSRCGGQEPPSKSTSD